MKMFETADKSKAKIMRPNEKEINRDWSDRCIIRGGRAERRPVRTPPRGVPARKAPEILNTALRSAECSTYGLPA
jgi:hypothetical protein